MNCQAGGPEEGHMGYCGCMEREHEGSGGHEEKLQNENETFEWGGITFSLNL